MFLSYFHVSLILGLNYKVGNVVKTRLKCCIVCQTEVDDCKAVLVTFSMRQCAFTVRCALGSQGAADLLVPVQIHCETHILIVYMWPQMVMFSVEKCTL